MMIEKIEGAPTKNALKDMQKTNASYNKKHKKSYFTLNPNVGDNDYNNKMFNKGSGNPYEGDVSAPVAPAGGESSGGDAAGGAVGGESLNIHEAFKILNSVDDVDALEESFLITNNKDNRDSLINKAKIRGKSAIVFYDDKGKINYIQEKSGLTTQNYKSLVKMGNERVKQSDSTSFRIYIKGTLVYDSISHGLEKTGTNDVNLNSLSILVADKDGNKYDKNSATPITDWESVGISKPNETEFNIAYTLYELSVKKSDKVYILNKGLKTIFDTLNPSSTSLGTQVLTKYASEHPDTATPKDAQSIGGKISNAIKNAVSQSSYRCVLWAIPVNDFNQRRYSSMSLLFAASLKQFKFFNYDNLDKNVESFVKKNSDIKRKMASTDYYYCVEIYGGETKKLVAVYDPQNIRYTNANKNIVNPDEYKLRPSAPKYDYSKNKAVAPVKKPKPQPKPKPEPEEVSDGDSIEDEPLEEVPSEAESTADETTKG